MLLSPDQLAVIMNAFFYVERNTNLVNSLVYCYNTCESGHIKLIM